jgi:hypothetical protein
MQDAVSTLPSVRTITFVSQPCGKVLRRVCWKVMDTKEAGRMGGIAKVRKGFAVLSQAERKRRAKAGAEARWGVKKATAAGRIKKKKA